MKSSSKILYLYAGLVYSFLYLPLSILVIFSFNEDKISISWTKFSWKWYQALGENKELWSCIYNSFILALLSTLGATLLGTLAALALKRYLFPFKRTFEMVLHIPLITPDIVLGVALLSYFAFLHHTFPFSIPLGLPAMLLGHITLCLPFVAIVVQARLADFDENLELAAQDLGATPWQSFWYVTFPLILPGIFAGALIAFTLSWDDYIISSLTTDAGMTTLPIYIYTLAKKGFSPEINAISTLTILFTLVLVSLALRLQKSS
jgi:spermidine/putrescine transport system permease protein